MLKVLEKEYPANKSENKNLAELVFGTFSQVVPALHTYEEIKYDDGVSHYDKLKEFIL